MSDEEIRVVVGVDFGTTFSGFAYAHVVQPDEIITQNAWPTGPSTTQTGQYKANTILHYDAECKKVVSWGCGTVAHSRRRRMPPNVHVVELFKLYLTSCKEKPMLPPEFDYQTAIRDYLEKMNAIIKEKLQTTWDHVIYPQNVRFIFAVPDEYGDHEKGIMRKLIYKAGFLDGERSPNLEFTKEPEAAAIYCLKRREEYNLKIGDKFLIVDCGGGTCDLTIRKLLDYDKISESTEGSSDICGGSRVDLEFVRFLDKKLGGSVMDKVVEHHYLDYQCLIDHWCRSIKHAFNGDPDAFEPEELEIDRLCPPVKEYMSEDLRTQFDNDDWLIEIDFESVKAMFDPIVDQIISLIRGQLASLNGGSVVITFLVGGFSENKYLQQRIKSEFQSRVPRIVCPKEPVAAIVRGATYYGLDLGIVRSRVLKWTYGLETHRQWKQGDPLERRKGNSRIKYFHIMAERGNEVSVSETCSLLRYPLEPDQDEITFPVYVSKEVNPMYTDEPGMKLLGKLTIELPDTHLKKDRPVEFSLTFGTMEITAAAVNRLTEQKYNIKLDLDLS